MIIYHNPGKTSRSRQKPKSLLDAFGIEAGGSVEWSHGATLTEITTEERQHLLQCCRWKEIKTAKALAVKALMRTKSCSQIIRHYQGKKGWRKSTIKNIHRALSISKGEGYTEK